MSSTALALLELPSSLGIPQHRDNRALGWHVQHLARVGYAGAPPTSPTSTLDLVDHATAQAWAGLEAIGQGFTGYGRGLLVDARAQAIAAWHAATTAGATAAAANIEILVDGISKAIAASGQGFGAALRGFLGASPKELLDDYLDRLTRAVDEGVLLVALVVLGGVFVATSGGGQAYLSSVGAGMGRALPEVAGGLRSVGGGYGRFLGELPGATVRGIEAYSPRGLLK